MHTALFSVIGEMTRTYIDERCVPEALTDVSLWFTPDGGLFIS
jgi:hypothetical protein